ncbi:homoserine dehydrogenase [gamma proteobacterium HTCC5015]|nr:homoserine dehydrogenase [gamma proteobacterium HTCC5015]
MLEPVRIGLLGVGTVGSGTVNVLKRNAEEIERRTGRQILVTRAAARNPDKLAADPEGIELGTDLESVVDADDVDVVVELIGGYEPARSLVLRAIENGKHVVTANKALIALHGDEIFAAAAQKGVSVAYEAAVAGGIPIIKSVREGLAGNRIEWLVGIINGTGNFILSEMSEKGREFDGVLKEAQELGYAEADPTFDIEGTDAAHKLTILASIAFGVPLQFDACYTEGISKLSPQDVKYAAELGYTVKHLGVARREDNGIELRVHPTLIPEKRLLANVNGVMNAVVVKADAVGPTLYYGAGAGAEPTASAVVADIIDVARLIGQPAHTHVPDLGFRAERMGERGVLDIEDIESAYYLRMQVKDRAGVMAKITSILAEQGISIEAVVQKEAEDDAADEPILPIFMVTSQIQEKSLNATLKELEALDEVVGSIVKIRIEYLD